MGKGKKKRAPSAAATDVAESTGDDIPPVDSNPGSNGDGVPPPPPKPSVEAANGREPAAETGSDEEGETDERRASSPERDGELGKLKMLNALLVREAVEERGKAAALAARVDEQSSDAAALACVERVVLQAALVVPLIAATEEDAVLRARLGAVQESLQAAEERAARETDARGEAAARLEAADLEKLRVLELLGAKEAEAGVASKNVAELEAVVVELAGKTTELSAERGKLEKELGEITALARRVHAQKAEVEGSFKGFKKNTEMYKQEMEEKLEEKLGELEVLRFGKAEMEAKFQSLEVELSAAVARNRELELEVEASKAEFAAARRDVAKLLFEVSEAGKKHGMVVAEADGLRVEIDEMMKALSDEKAEGGKLRLRIGELESYNGEKDRDIGVLKAEVKNKGEQIDGLNGDLEQLQLAVAEAQQREKSGMWTWLCPATTTVIAAASFAYTARSR